MERDDDDAPRQAVAPLGGRRHKISPSTATVPFVYDVFIVVIFFILFNLVLRFTAHAGCVCFKRLRMRSAGCVAGGTGSPLDAAS